MFRLDSVRQALVALVASVLVLSGCRPAALFAPLGDSQRGSGPAAGLDTPAPRMASLLVKVQWPRRDLPGFKAATIPTTTNTIVVKVTGNGRDPVVVPITRPAVPATEPVVRVIDIPEGDNLTVEVKAYRESAPVPDTAVPVAAGTAAIPQALAGKMISVPITLTAAFAPTITKLSAYGAPDGYMLTVTGNNFGSGSTPLEVKFNGMDPIVLDPAKPQLLTRTSPTQLVVRVPGQAVTGPLVVTADGIPGEENTIFWRMENATLKISVAGNYLSTVLGAGATASISVEQNISYRFPPLKSEADFTGKPGRFYSVVDSAIATVSVGTGFADVLKATTAGTTKIRAFVGSVGSDELAVSVIKGYILQTVAGRGGGIGDGGSAASAELLQPLGIAVTSGGDLLVADQGHNRIRRLGTTASTEAGTESVGLVNGPTAAARFSSPASLAIDASGSLYVADQGNSVIRKVSGGTVSTVAGTGVDGYAGDGGTATNALLNYPQGVAVTPDGHVIVADTYNHRIRFLSTGESNLYGFAAPTGTIWNLAGTGEAAFADGSRLAAKFNTPTAVAVDASGSIYIADSGNHRIRMMTTGGTVTTIAGDGSGGFAGDGGDATAASLFNPQGVAVDASGSIYVADTDNNRIRVFTPGATISTIAGNGAKGSAGDGGQATAAQLSNPKAVAVSGDYLYISEFGTNRIRRVTLSTGVITTVAGAASADGGQALDTQLASPRGVTLDPSGKLVIADTDRNVIRRLNDDGTLTTVAGSGLASDAGDGGDPLQAGFNQPMSARYQGDVLYVVDGRNGRVRAIGGTSDVTAFGMTIPAGKITTVAGGGNTSFTEGAAAVGNTLLAPVAVAFLADGDMLITDENANAIYKVAKADGKMFRYAGGQDGAAGFLSASPLTSLLRGPRGIMIDADGSVVFVDGGNHAVRRIKNDQIVTIAGTGGPGTSDDNTEASVAQLNSPWDAVPDGSGGLYITDSGNSTIRWITSAGIITTLAGSVQNPGFAGDGLSALTGKLSQPRGLVRASNGTIYFADSNNHRIRKLTSQ